MHKFESDDPVELLWVAWARVWVRLSASLGLEYSMEGFPS